MQHLSRLTVGALLALALTVSLLLLWGSPRAQSDDPVIRARQLLLDEPASAGFRPDLSDLRLLSVRQGLSAEHVRYQQTANGLPVFGAYVSVSLPKDGNAQPLLTSRHVAGLQPNTPVPVLTSAEALAIALDQIGAGSTELQWPASSELMYYPADKRGYVLAWQIVAPTLNPLGSWLVLVDAAGGEVLYKHDLIRYDNGRVFDPNPAKTNGGTAPAPNCDTTTNEGLLAGQYRTKDLVGIDTGQNKLKGAYADLTAPGIPDLGYKLAGQANEASRSYVYACNDDRFEEVMAYYHVDAAQRKLQSLGFTGQSAVYDSPAPIHAHWFPDCNAFYHPISRGLHFGDSATFGCPVSTDLAEDADVIVHEYGHALQDEQIPGWGFGPYPLAEQAASMGEGFADFLTGAIFGDPCLGEYANFGNNACAGSPGLRWLQNQRSYPAGFEACPDVDFTGDTIPESEEPHCGGEVWGGVLWDLVEGLPGGVNQANRDLALTLVMDAQFYLDPVATFNEAAAAVCLADNILYNGAHVPAITAAFAGRGIATAPCGASDFPYLYLRIIHTFAGDLDINVKVGANVNAPVCQFVILNGPIFFPGPFVAYGSLTTPADCAGHLPPTTAQPWWLEVRDQASIDVGTIENFEISLAGGTRCVAADTPVFIPDNDGFVYSKVDCTNQSGPPGSTTPTPTPGPQTPTPSITGSSPPSPANDNNPEIFGSAVAGSTVRLFTNAGCSGTPAVTGTNASFASPGLTVSVSDNSSTTFYANATVGSSTSGCSSGLTYVENSTGSGVTFSVNSTTDAVDASPGNGVCATGGGQCTLRAAIQEANALAGQDFINLAAGTYTLSIGGTGEDSAASGDLDITEAVGLSGSLGLGTSTVIDGGALDRVLDVHSGPQGSPGFLGLSYLTVRNGALSGANGAGILVASNAALSVAFTTIMGNTTNGFGGGIFNFGTVNLDVSTVSGNSVAGGGGGISNAENATLTVTNSTVSGNSSGSGGGGIGNSGALTLTNSTVHVNSATGLGGAGILTFGTANLKNAIVAANGPPGSNCSGSITSAGHNLEDANTCGLTGPGDLINRNPLLGPLANNGGRTQTHALLAGSPAIDAGDDVGCPAFDQRLVSRPQGAHCDIGSYEFEGSLLGSITIFKDAVPNGPTDFSYTDNIPGCVVGPLDDDGDATLSNTVTCSNVDAAGDPYAVTENDPSPAFALIALTCDDANSTENLATRTATINLEPGEHVTCTFTNQLTTAGSYYHPVSPYRILDTRSGSKVGHDAEIIVDVTGGPSGVPATGVSAVVINTTVTEPTAASYLTVFPTGVPRPTASNLNFLAGQTVPNLVTVKVGADGNLKVYNAVGQAHVIFDVVGWYGGPSGGSRFNALSPQRIVDTRTSGPGKLPPGFELVVRVTIGGITPTAFVLNATVTGPTANSYLTFYRCGTVRPTSSNLNFEPGQTVPNLVIVPVGTDGCFRVYNEAGATHVILDLVGVYGATGDLFYPLKPCRTLDTRSTSGKVPAGTSINVDVTGPCEVPASGVSAVIMNTTVTAPTAPSYLTVYPSDPRPTASNLNFLAGQTIPNLVMVRVGSDGNVKAYNAAGQTHVIMDAVGYFAP